MENICTIQYGHVQNCRRRNVLRWPGVDSKPRSRQEEGVDHRHTIQHRRPSRAGCTGLQSSYHVDRWRADGRCLQSNSIKLRMAEEEQTRAAYMEGLFMNTSME